MRYHIDSVEYESTIGVFYYKGEQSKLSAMGTRVLNYFLKNPGRLITYQQLMDDVWETVVSENAVVQILTHIRQTFKQCHGDVQLIETLRSQGFILNSALDIKATRLPRQSESQKNRLWMGLSALIFSLIIYQWYTSRTVGGSDNISAAQLSRLLSIPSFDSHFANKDEHDEIQMLMNKILQTSGGEVGTNHQLLSVEMQQAAFEQLLALNEMMDETSNPKATAAVFFTMSRVYQHQGELGQAVVYFNKTLALLKELDDIQRSGLVHSKLAGLYVIQGQPKLAFTHYQASFEVAQQLKKPRLGSMVLNNMIKLKINQGKFDEALSLNEQLSKIADRAQLQNSRVKVLQWHAIVSLETRQFDSAARYIEEHATMAGKSRSKLILGSQLLLQLRLALAQSNVNEADRLVTQLSAMTDHEVIKEYFIPIYAEYLSVTKQPQKLIDYLMAEKELALKNNDSLLSQQLELLLAQHYLLEAPNTAVQMLKNIELNGFLSYQYYSLLAEALNGANNHQEAMEVLKKARLHQNQFDAKELEELALNIQKALTNDDY